MTNNPGVTFGGMHSYTQFGLKMLPPEVSEPEPVIIKTEIPGRNGAIDYSEALTGHIVYKNRTLVFSFRLCGTSETDYIKKLQNVVNTLHGKKMTVIIDADPDYQYAGRLKVANDNINDFMGIVKVTCDAYPYKRKITDTIVQESFCGKNMWDMANAAEWLPTQNTFWEVAEQPDGSWKWKASSQREIIPIPGKKNTAYTLSMDIMVTLTREWTNARSLEFNFYYDDGTITTNALSVREKDVWTAKQVTSNPKKTLIGIGVMCLNSSNVTTYTKNIQLEAGTSKTDYESYTPQTKGKTIVLSNLSEPVVPKIICSHPVDIVCGGLSSSLGIGTRLTDLVLSAGGTPVTITTEGPVAFRYKEGSL